MTHTTSHTTKGLTAVAIAAGIIMTAAAPVQAKDAFADFMAEIEQSNRDSRTCRKDVGIQPNDVVYSACTRWIKDARVENDTLVQMYASRAIVGTDETQRCSDAQTSFSIATKEFGKYRSLTKSYVASLERLATALCRG